MFKKLIGDRAFYAKIFALAFPIMIQNGITNLVNMLDNIMVGRVGTVQMTGVAATNQLMFVFNLCVFGAISGAGIFGAQFYGSGDHKGVRDAFRFKVVFCTLFAMLGIVLFLTCGDPLINLYLKGEGSAEDAAASLRYARSYMNIMLIGLIPFSVSQCYSSTLRETDCPMLPMIAGLVAVGVNVSLNTVLIFGLLGFPALGVNGAAIATVISRFAELAVLIIFTPRIKDGRTEFIKGAFKSLKIPMALVGQIMVKGMPLMVNEALWATGVAVLNQCYSERGLDVLAANSISQTYWNVFSVAFMAIGVAIGILLGQTLGAGQTDEAKSSAVKLIFFSVAVSVAVSAVYAVCAEFIPTAYKTSDEVRITATRLMQISAIAMPVDAFANACYFTLRSGGKSLLTMIFDSASMWLISVPAAFIISRFTGMPILPFYAIIQALMLIKCVVGWIFVKKGIWIKTII